MAGRSDNGEALPQRTRGHVIADLSVNFVERLVLEEGHIATREYVDYGYDLSIRTFNEHGFMEPDLILLQMKATDDIAAYEQSARDRLAFSVEMRHVRLWRSETMPVFLILYDARGRRAYWLDLHNFLSSRSPRENAKTLTLHIPNEERASPEYNTTDAATEERTVARMRRDDAMTNGKVTYGQLFEALRSLGYLERAGRFGGRPAVIFEHPRYGDVARVILPPVELDEEVASMHVLGVRTYSRQRESFNPTPPAS